MQFYIRKSFIISYREEANNSLLLHNIYLCQYTSGNYFKFFNKIDIF